MRIIGADSIEWRSSATYTHRITSLVREFAVSHLHSTIIWPQNLGVCEIPKLFCPPQMLLHFAQKFVQT